MPHQDNPPSCSPLCRHTLCHFDSMISNVFSSQKICFQNLSYCVLKDRITTQMWVILNEYILQHVCYLNIIWHCLHFFKIQKFSTFMKKYRNKIHLPHRYWVWLVAYSKSENRYSEKSYFYSWSPIPHWVASSRNRFSAGTKIYFAMVFL